MAAGKASAEELTAWRRHVRLCDACAITLARARAGWTPAAPATLEAPAPGDVSAERCADVGLEPNLQIGEFRLEKRLGTGGMGVVYQAMQVPLNRRVALKVLPFNLAGDASAVARFGREARAAARLRHANIVTIHAEGTERNACYFAMEMIDGQNLDEVIEDLRRAKALAQSRADRHAASEEEVHDASFVPSVLHVCRSEGEYFRTVASLICEVAGALDYAHDQGVIHRDVKPSNLMLARDGRLVLLDFGIARMQQERAMTLTGSFAGTPRYMSPEQISDAHGQVDHRCDIYSLGVTLYELLTLEPLFQGTTQHQVIGQILTKEPRRPRQINRRIPVDLETICCKAIEKEAGRRYQTAGAMAEDLRRFVDGRVITAHPPDLIDRAAKLVRRRKVAVVLTAIIAILSILVGAIGWRHYLTRWANQYAAAEIDGLLEQDRYLDAFLLARKAQRYIPGSPLLEQRWPLMSREFIITTRPSRTKIFVGEYSQGDPHWLYLGRTPLQQVRIPFGTYRWRVQRAGFIPVEVVRTNEAPAPEADRAALPPRQLQFALHASGDYPADMAWIPETTLTQELLYHGTRTIPEVPAYAIDKYEVTNSDYKAFVAGGGYENEAYWQEPFIRDGRAVPFAEAMAAFRDRTGDAGPATWRHGSYPRGQGRHPVGGISWYEAAAYARFCGKDLPTIFHWTHAARADDEPYRITRLSNFSHRPAAVGRYKGMGRFGLYDAAGNVREWCYNAVEGKKNARCVLGGTWDEHDTAFINGALRCPWDRDPANGARCVRYPGGRETVPAEAFAPVECRCRDFANFEPVSDEVFRSYIETWYRYDPTPLNARVELVDDELGYCWRERISFDAAYPNERVTAYLHLPADATPPYQPVVWFPTGMARFSPWDERAYTPEMVSIIRSGRAVIVPFYKGTYDRKLDKPTYPPDGIQSRNLYIQRSQDLRRTIDYLQTRQDIDVDRLAYVGLAWGGQMGPVMVAPEPRFKAGVFLLGGICACKRHPASDPANFAPRVEIPILMLNGREDSRFPYETAQKPLFRLLGTPEPHKRHILLPGEHCIGWEYRRQYHEQIGKWLDEYLGPVRRSDDSEVGDAETDATVSSVSGKSQKTENCDLPSQRVEPATGCVVG